MPNKPAKHHVGEECPSCGFVHMTTASSRNPSVPACVGHNRSAPHGPCKQPPKRGQNVCGSHGGRTPAALAAGARRENEAKLADVARRLIPNVDERTPIRNPLERLLELAAEADAFRESLRILANTLDDDIAAGNHGEQLRAEVATYRAALRDVTDMLVAIAKLDIESLLARIESRKVDLVMTALTAGLDDAKLSADQKRTVVAGVGRHLRLVRDAAS